ncbi:MAG: hypothetical protein Q8P04_00250 [bacterium]|nr:hypothetical protein [bacterium]
MNGEFTGETGGSGELEEQEWKKRQAERDKVSLVEGLLLLMLAATADLFEIVAGLTIILWLIGLVLGSLASGIIFMWAVLRGGESYLIFRRVIITVGGWLFDIVLLGILPIRTIALLLTFWINNRDANRRIKEATERIVNLKASPRPQSQSRQPISHEEWIEQVLKAGPRPQSQLQQPISPSHEEGYMYHGTTQPWALQIAEKGLEPRPQQSWHDLYADIGDKPLTYFSDQPEYASEWADSLSQREGREPMLLRVPNSYSEGISSYVDTHLSTKTIPPEDVQAWNGSQWVAMKHMASPDSYDESGQWIPDAERNIKPVKYEPDDPDDPWN